MIILLEIGRHCDNTLSTQGLLLPSPLMDGNNFVMEDEELHCAWNMF